MYGIVRKVMLLLSESRRAQGLILGLGPTRRMARRFVPGETLAEALDVVEALQEEGLHATLDNLGENVASEAEAAAVADTYMAMLTALHKRDLHSGVSIKLTNLGLALAEETAYENLKRVVTHASMLQRFVRIDMEESDHVEATLSIYRRLRREFDNLGVVLQAYLHRTPDDVAALVRRGMADVRIVKGAYQEPPSVAHQRMRDIRRAFMDVLQILWAPGGAGPRARVAVASHDTRIIAFAQSLAARSGVTPAEFEFQFLYGVRSRLAEELVRQGHRMRLYVPFGTRWYGYFMRRLAERPANLIFFVRALFGR